MNDEESDDDDVDPANTSCRRSHKAMHLVYECPVCERREFSLSPQPPFSPHGNDAKRRYLERQKNLKYARKQARRSRDQNIALFKENENLKKGLAEEHQLVVELYEDLSEKNEQYSKVLREKSDLTLQLSKTKRRAPNQTQSTQPKKRRRKSRFTNRHDVVKLVKKDSARIDLSEKVIKTKVLPMMKYLGTGVHKRIDALRTPQEDKVRLTNALASPKAALGNMLNKDKYAEHKKLKLKPRCLWDMYQKTMNRAMPGLYVIHKPTQSNRNGGAVKISTDDDDKYDDDEYKSTVDKLFGQANMSY